MEGGWASLILGVVLGLAINECGEVSPWLARRLVRWAADVRYPGRAEELEAVIHDRPGKLFKLFTAFGFVCAALVYRATRRRSAHRMSLAGRLAVRLSVAGLAPILFLGQLILVALLPSEIPRVHYYVPIGRSSSGFALHEGLVPSPAVLVTLVVVMYLVTQLAFLLAPRLLLPVSATIVMFLGVGLESSLKPDLWAMYGSTTTHLAGVFPIDWSMFIGSMFLVMLPAFWLAKRLASMSPLASVTLSMMMVMASAAGSVGLGSWVSTFDRISYSTFVGLCSLAHGGVLGLGAGACVGISWLIFNAMKERWWSTTSAVETGTSESYP